MLTNGSPQRHAAFEQLTAIKTQAQREADDADYYEVLAKQSRKLQNRLAEIVKLLTFSGNETSELMAAIGHYKTKDGVITKGKVRKWENEKVREKKQVREAIPRLFPNPVFGAVPLTCSLSHFHTCPPAEPAAFKRAEVQ